MTTSAFVLTTPAELAALVEGAVKRALEQHAPPAAPPADADWMTLEAAAAMLGYAPGTLRKRRDVPFHRTGAGKSGRRRYRRSELERWIASRPAA